MKRVGFEDEDRIRKARNIANCDKGLHRWSKAYEKTEDGKDREWRYCQTCGVEDDAEL